MTQPRLDIRPLAPYLAKLFIEQSPKHAIAATNYKEKEKKKPTPSILLGRAVDFMVFGSGDSRDPEPTETWKKKAKPIVDAVFACLEENKLDHSEAKLQQSLEWTTPSGCPARGRMDWFWDRFGIEIDLKTIAEGSDYKIENQIRNYGYDIAQAAYVEGIEANFYIEPRTRLLFVETVYPYDARLVPVPRHLMQEGLNRWRRACQGWIACHKSGVWPGRGNEVAWRPQYGKVNDPGFVDLEKEGE